MTKSAALSLVTMVVILACGIVCGQDMPSNYEHLKCYDQLIGTWEYDGPVLEDVSDIAKKDDGVVGRLSYKWILDKNAVEIVLHAEVTNGFKFTAKTLVGWDSAEQQIVEGGFNTMGGNFLGVVTYDESSKTWTLKVTGADGDGEPVSNTTVGTLKDKDTLVIRTLDRKGGPLQGDGPEITYKRVKRPKQPKRVKQAK